MHNITSYPVTERPGTESYDPVLLGGKSVRANPCIRDLGAPSTCSHSWRPYSFALVLLLLIAGTSNALRSSSTTIRMLL